MFNKNAKLLLSMAMALPLSANAYQFMGTEPSHFSYNYAEAYFVDNDFDSGFSIGGSYDINNSIAVIGSYTIAGDVTAIKIGAAHHAKADFLERADLVLHASYDSFEYEISAEVFDINNPPSFTRKVSAGIDDSGFALGATIRHELQDRIEVFGDVTYTTIFDGDIQFTGGVEYTLNDKVSVRGSYTLADSDTLAIGARYYFK